MRAHKASQRSSSGRARKQKLLVQAQASFDLLPRRFFDPTVAAPQPERRSATPQRAGDGLRGSKEQNVAFCKRREGIVLSACLSTSATFISLNSFIDITCIYYSSPTAAMFFTAETFPTGCAVPPNAPARSNVPRKAATRRTTIWTARKGYSVLSPYNKRFKL